MPILIDTDVIKMVIDSDVLGVGVEPGGAAGTLDASYYKGCGNRSGKERTMVAPMENSKQDGRVRRLTVIECERLQGLPDGYSAPAGSDSARYKALGNGMCQPCADYVMAQIMRVLREEKEDGSIQP